MPPSVLSRIWGFCLSVVENYRSMWSIVVTKMGNVTDTEDQGESIVPKSSTSDYRSSLLKSKLMVNCFMLSVTSGII